MRTKVRVLANIFVEDHLDESLFQFNRVVPIYYYHAIRAFVKNCPLIKNATEEDFQTVIVITILCSNDENAMTILHGLEGCAKNSFFDELTRKKANAVDTESIKIALNSVYGKDVFNTDTDTYKLYVNIFYADSPADESRILNYSNDSLTENTYHELLSFLEKCPNILYIINPIEDGKTKYICFVCSNIEKAIDILLQIEDLCEKPDEEIDSVESDIYYIAHNLDIDDLFLQMSEEASELSQTCLKYVRAHKGNNPTKESEDFYLKGIIEEFTDVQVCAEVIDITDDNDIHDSKIHRWADRIRKKNGGNAK